MCVDKHHYKCCGCISLTAATSILGCLYLLAKIYYAIISEWGAFAIYLITFRPIGRLFDNTVYFKTYDKKMRRQNINNPAHTSNFYVPHN